jgi:hypothetical protein
MQIRRTFLRSRKRAWKTSDFHGPDSLALSEEVYLCERSSNGRAFLGGLDYHQGANILSAEHKLRRVTESLRSGEIIHLDILPISLYFRSIRASKQ